MNGADFTDGGHSTGGADFTDGGHSTDGADFTDRAGGGAWRREPSGG
ncbi:hypothetical protein [Streptomyces qinglanensis]|nr:hypothetical protein [Streptomyces qinglanensis]